MATIRRRLGPWSENLKQAGLDLEQLNRALIERGRQRQQDNRAFGHAIAETLREEGHQVTFDGHLHVLNFPEFTVRPKLLWPTAAEGGPSWLIRINKLGQQADLDLLVRMEDRGQPKDYFLATPADILVRFPRTLPASIPADLVRFWCPATSTVLERLRTLRTLHSEIDSNDADGKDPNRTVKSRSQRRIASI